MEMFMPSNMINIVYSDLVSAGKTRILLLRWVHDYTVVGRRNTSVSDVVDVLFFPCVIFVKRFFCFSKKCFIKEKKRNRERTQRLNMAAHMLLLNIPLVYKTKHAPDVALFMPSWYSTRQRVLFTLLQSLSGLISTPKKHSKVSVSPGIS